MLIGNNSNNLNSSTNSKAI